TGAATTTERASLAGESEEVTHHGLVPVLVRIPEGDHAAARRRDYVRLPSPSVGSVGWHRSDRADGGGQRRTARRFGRNGGIRPVPVRRLTGTDLIPRRQII